MSMREISDDDILYWQGHPVTKLFLQLLQHEKNMLIDLIMRKGKADAAETHAKGIVTCLGDIAHTVEELRSELLWAKLIDRSEEVKIT